MTGMPSGRCFPFAFSMYTRLTGRAVGAASWWRNRSARAAFPGAVTTTTLSTPAVWRPALSSVTRRTLESALARDRSINFCKLRTFFRSPACDAVKMRCRRRRTSSSTFGQSIDGQSRASPSGPFATAMPPWCPTCPSVLESSVTFLTGSPDPRQPPFGSGSCPCPASYAERPTEDRPWCPGFLSPFGGRRSLLGSSISRWGLGPSLRSADRLRHDRTPTGFPRSTRSRCDRGGCLLYPGGGGAHPTDKKSPAGACRFAAASPSTSLPQPIWRGSSITRHQRRFTQFTRPVCPLPVVPGWNGDPSASPRASHPAVASSARRGWGQAIEHGPGATQPA